MKHIILPPGPTPTSLTAKCVIRSLGEHRRAYNNYHNKNGFVEDELTNAVNDGLIDVDGVKKVFLGTVYKPEPVKEHKKYVPSPFVYSSQALKERREAENKKRKETEINRVEREWTNKEKQEIVQKIKSDNEQFVKSLSDLTNVISRFKSIPISDFPILSSRLIFLGSSGDDDIHFDLISRLLGYQNYITAKKAVRLGHLFNIKILRKSITYYQLKVENERT